MTKYILPILWMMLIIFLSSISGSTYPAAAFDWAPLAHFFEYAVLVWLILRIFKLNLKTTLLILVFCALFALSDEIHQLYVSNRSASIMDWLVDLLAIITMIYFKINFQFNKNKKEPLL